MNEGYFSPSGSDTKAPAVETLPHRPIAPQSVKDTRGSRSFLSRCFLIAWVSATLLGLGILLLPEGRKEALVRRDGWAVQGAFLPNLRPASGEVSRNILKDPQSVFWTSWTPDTNGAPGRITSAPFLAPRVLAVPFSGFPGELGVELYLECLENGKRLRIAHGNAHYAWVERTMWLPAAWCDSDSRLVASSTRAGVYIAVGTPFSSSLVAWLKESVFVVVLVHALACVLLFGPGLAVAWLAGILKLETALFVALPGTFLTAYIAFFWLLLWPSHHAGRRDSGGTCGRGFTLHEAADPSRVLKPLRLRYPLPAVLRVVSLLCSSALLGRPWGRSICSQLSVRTGCMVHRQSTASGCRGGSLQAPSDKVPGQ